MTVDKATMQALRDRGIELNPPVSSLDFGSFCKELSITPGRDFRDVYGLFNGFTAHDGASMLMLWDTGQIVSSKHLYERGMQSRESVPIGDYFIDSDVIMASISDDEAKVSLLFEKRELAPSIEEFISRLVAGTFDLR